MDLKISNNQLRFRITKEELKILLSTEDTSQTLQCTTHFSNDHYLTFEIISMEQEIQNEPLMLHCSKNKLSLFVNKHKLRQIKIPSIDGIEVQNEQLTLILEVDIRKKAITL